MHSAPTSGQMAYGLSDPAKGARVRDALAHGASGFCPSVRSDTEEHTRLKCAAVPVTHEAAADPIFCGVSNRPRRHIFGTVSIPYETGREVSCREVTHRKIQCRGPRAMVCFALP